MKKTYITPAFKQVKRKPSRMLMTSGVVGETKTKMYWDDEADSSEGL
jgi:hypothetical protein